MEEKDYKYSDITRKIIGCAMEVHSTMGNGYPEMVYQKCLAVEFEQCKVQFSKEFNMILRYKGKIVGERRVDFFVEEKVMVELKSITKLEDIHLAQALNYLEAGNLEVGLLINFGAKSLEFKRLVNRRRLDPNQ